MQSNNIIKFQRFAKVNTRCLICWKNSYGMCSFLYLYSAANKPYQKVDNIYPQVHLIGYSYRVREKPSGGIKYSQILERKCAKYLNEFQPFTWMKSRQILEWKCVQALRICRLIRKLLGCARLFDKILISRTRLQQFCMRAACFHTPIFQHHNAIDMFNRFHTMRDDDHSFVFYQISEGFLNF